MLLQTISNAIRQFFTRCSNVRPIIWIGLYILLVPIFAYIYWQIPTSQFRIPDNAPTDYGSWLYYSIVTITTLGFGDYTPAHSIAQSVTAIEVMCGLVLLGFFLNAVGSLKSSIAVETELEKQQKIHKASETKKLNKLTPLIIHQLNQFLTQCTIATTPITTNDQSADQPYNANFKLKDLAYIFSPRNNNILNSNTPAITSLLKSADRTSLMLDSLQNKVDLTLWPQLMEESFSFVAQWQLFSSTDSLLAQTHTSKKPTDLTKLAMELESIDTSDKTIKNPSLTPIIELYHFIKNTASLSINIEKTLVAIDNA